jgi:erythromycin esterase-like protein
MVVDTNVCPFDASTKPRTLVKLAYIPKLIRDTAKYLPSITDSSFGATFDTFGKSHIVLIGDASHGTAEFYRARAAITKHLIQEHDFDMVAVEADWPDAMSIDHYVRLKPKLHTKESSFSRFPTWMWSNTEVHDFVTWLREHNSGLRPRDRTGFYGLDLYSLYNSTNAVVKYLDRVDPEAAKAARNRYACLSPWIENPHKYGLAALTKGYAPCEEAVVKVLVDLLLHRLEYTKMDGEDFMDAEQNAYLVADAEQYYRAMYYGDALSWNLRDTHMFETLERLFAFKGPKSKVVVWAHNSHVGDARFTGMGMQRKELNIGQLCRERFGKDVAIIGFGTHTGTVAAARNWEESMQVMKVNPSLEGSYERLAHDAGVPNFWLDLRKGQINEALRQALMQPRIERFIEVIYRPDKEFWSHYSKAILPRQFDAYVWIDETTAVKPLHVEPIHHAVETDETYPFGL